MPSFSFWRHQWGHTSLAFPNNATNLGPSIQIPEPTGNIYYSNHHNQQAPNWDWGKSTGVFYIMFKTFELISRAVHRCGRGGDTCCQHVGTKCAQQQWNRKAGEVRRRCPQPWRLWEPSPIVLPVLFPIRTVSPDPQLQTCKYLGW